MAMVLASTLAGGLNATNAIASDKAKTGLQTRNNPLQPGDEVVALSISARCETTARFGSNDPNDPVDGTVNKTITEWLAAGNKAEWKVDFGLDGPALGDAEDEIDDSGYGTNLFLTRPETKTAALIHTERRYCPTAACSIIPRAFSRTPFQLPTTPSSMGSMVSNSTCVLTRTAIPG
ncbi:hypothetical protein NKH89_12385 [Mesorhizobium sp. M0923]|uniref:hypothetical protein n=1 Tax=unclassified Mesorhizobium TaxID=325217 RepID=UPI00041C6870|nr:hypothetical protein [Mesorhizobium sp. L48C026A00]